MRTNLCLAILACLALAMQAQATPLAGDLDGDGLVGVADEVWLAQLYGTTASDPGFAPAADLTGDGCIDVRDLARLGAAWGSSGGTVDVTPPTLRITLNDIPDDMDDLLVVPPDGFEITVRYDAGDGSVIDPGSLAVFGSLAIGAEPAWTDLADHLSAGQTLASWRIPSGSELARTTHMLAAQVRDAAGNPAVATYSYAVRDFAYGVPPLGAPQRIFLDFGQNRSLGPEIDFLEDLRRYGLSTASAAAVETRMLERLKAEIVGRTHDYYDRSPGGSQGVDPVNVTFSATAPTPPYSRLCIGGQSSLGSIYLGAALLDVNNANQASDECNTGGQYGVFPRAIGTLWGSSPAYQAAIHPLDPAVGGTPVGAHALDETVTAPEFDPATASPEALVRWNVIENAVDAFAQAVATATAHETGHMLGLVAHGAAPGGLWGGSSGGAADHNVTTAGSTPTENHLMNAGGSFTFQEMTGRDGLPLPVFRPLNWAYLHDRVVLDAQVTGLFPAPVIASLSPNPVTVPPGGSATLTITGSGFLLTPSIYLIIEGDPTPNALLSETLVSSTIVTAVVNAYLVPPGIYDVQLTNGDGQVLLVPDALVVQ